jgi:hypothetical protein
MQARAARDMRSSLSLRKQCFPAMGLVAAVALPHPFAVKCESPQLRQDYSDPDAIGIPGRSRGAHVPLPLLPGVLP